MSRSNSTRYAFTLIELLVTIGIIAVLLGILFPVVSKLKKSAYGASTGQTINTLTAAINAYQAVFQAYPGPFDWNAPVGSRFQVNALNPTGVTTPANITQAESLLLALSGGLRITAPAGVVTAFNYDATLIGKGPSSLNPRRMRQYQVFVDAGSKLSNPTDVDVLTDTIIPEFVDAFPEPLPILYSRARRGNTGTLAQYPASDFGYGFDTGGMFGPLKDFASAQAYYGDPSYSMNEPRQKDQFILISAGADGKYGTKDDITNFGSPGK